ncbi:unnamed protein product [Meganyctiphanes norvegica]|uniref:GTP cyclohydrolase 1 feedback regulatory protein n=1 Tax=Meganyctiphanes norvegica TaxID=48144 RepID=A0AAV2R785_MEGNR
MPYMVISTSKWVYQNKIITVVGDLNSDSELMTYLQAEIPKPNSELYTNRCLIRSHYITPLLPQQVLDLLERKDWRVVCSSGGPSGKNHDERENWLWTLHK